MTVTKPQAQMRVTTVRLSEELLSDAEMVARIDGITFSELVRLAVAAHVGGRRLSTDFAEKAEAHADEAPQPARRGRLLLWRTVRAGDTRRLLAHSCGDFGWRRGMTVTKDQAQMLATLAAAARPHGARRWDTAGTMAAIGGGL